MGRMTPAELEQLKRGVSLRAVAQSQGHTLKKQGADSYVCQCAGRGAVSGAYA